ncbi:hypothetical protein CYMTET_16043 [Cymbomonas tetramitiformis]|uniref:Uncharacterized protein n=1 Tax=Cymbomonas tetramitiformis TaxID=36881 RepID=A0AAE0L8B4_9CHLO|nr:hypothetical protein CYMTET_16043 [Cymbomonas tetramitiformis]
MLANHDCVRVNSMVVEFYMEDVDLSTLQVMLVANNSVAKPSTVMLYNGHALESPSVRETENVTNLSTKVFNVSFGNKQDGSTLGALVRNLSVNALDQYDAISGALIPDGSFSDVIVKDGFR